MTTPTSSERCDRERECLQTGVVDRDCLIDDECGKWMGKDVHRSGNIAMCHRKLIVQAARDSIDHVTGCKNASADYHRRNNTQCNSF